MRVLCLNIKIEQCIKLQKSQYKHTYFRVVFSGAMLSPEKHFVRYSAGEWFHDGCGALKVEF